MNALSLSSRINVLLTNDEAECGAVTADDLGKEECSESLSLQKLKMMMGKSQIHAD